MRSGVWRLLCGFALALPFAGCSGGYPLPPTRCDEWCDVTLGDMCQDYYQPAGCVSQCEEANMDAEPCRAAFDAQLSCFRNSPRALEQRCTFDQQPDDCDAESQQLLLCVADQYATAGTGKR